jgi:hypothetical protein
VHHSPGNEQRASGNPQKPLQPPSVEADDNLIVNGDDRHGQPPRSRNQLFTGCRVVRDVLRRELDAVRRKELFRRVTRLSG